MLDCFITKPACTKKRKLEYGMIINTFKVFSINIHKEQILLNTLYKCSIYKEHLSTNRGDKNIRIKIT